MKHPILRKCLCVVATVIGSSHAEVMIERGEDGHLCLHRNGKPFVIRGACGTDHLAVLKEIGGNSIRTYGIEQLEQRVDGKNLLDRCAELDLAVAAGIWVQHERHGFDYSDTARVREQREMVRAAVNKYRGHKALLLWSLGNEVEGVASSARTKYVWQELNELAAIIKAADPDHPVMTVIAGSDTAKVKDILQYYPNLDILGVNAYAGARAAAIAFKTAGWNKPFVLTEFGPPGHWEVPKTPWGTSIEPSSRDKAASYYALQRHLIKENLDITLGSYCFFWGQKQETTSTWYGMFLKSGEKLPQVDAMCRAWTDRWPANRCPRVERLESELRDAIAAPGQLHTLRVTATDPDGDPLSYHWTITAESTDIRSGGDKETEPLSFFDCIIQSESDPVLIRTPENPGNYRVFLTVKDGKGSACTENFCFRVELPATRP